MCLLTGATIIWWLSSQQKKIAVVDAVKLFDSYNMKNELEGIAKRQLQAESKEVDSMRNVVQMAQAVNGNEDEVKKFTMGYNYMKSRLESDYTQSNRDINEKVWKRLNPLLDEYGKKNHLHLMIGANGMGSVLYNDDYYDLTNDVIKFANKKYEEGN